MASRNIKAYNTLAEKLEKLADGVLQHSGEENFPATLKDQAIRELRSSLEVSRQAYDTAMNSARIKHDEYSNKQNEITDTYTRFTTMLYGFYGKKNQVLGDFGLAPYKATGKKGPRNKNNNNNTGS
jgi:hypothetical protein